jgi:anti-sigma factor RsiW
MRCYRARRWLSAYIDDEIDPRRREALEAHIAGCEACSAELRRLKEHWEALVEGDRAPPPPPSDLWGQILESLDGAERLPWHRQHRGRLLQAACVAACVVLGFSGGALLSWRQPSAVVATNAAAMGERMMVAEAFDDTAAFGLTEGKEGLLRCVPK